MDGYALHGNSREYAENFAEILDNMISDMTGAIPSCDISESFIRQIVPYFAAGAAMSENILNFSTNIAINRFADNTCAFMRTFTDSAKIAASKAPSHTNRIRDCRVYNKNADIIMNNMFYGINSATPSKRANCSFLSEITAHHSGGIVFCENVLKFDIAAELRPFVCASAAFLRENKAIACSLSAKLSCGEQKILGYEN